MSLDFRGFLDSDYNEFAITETGQNVTVAIGNSHARDWDVKRDGGQCPQSASKRTQHIAKDISWGSRVKL